VVRAVTRVGVVRAVTRVGVVRAVTRVGVARVGVAGVGVGHVFLRGCLYTDCGFIWNRILHCWFIWNNSHYCWFFIKWFAGVSSPKVPIPAPTKIGSLQVDAVAIVIAVIHSHIALINISANISVSRVSFAAGAVEGLDRVSADGISTAWSITDLTLIHRLGLTDHLSTGKGAVGIHTNLRRTAGTCPLHTLIDICALHPIPREPWSTQAEKAARSIKTQSILRTVVEIHPALIHVHASAHDFQEPRATETDCTVGTVLALWVWNSGTFCRTSRTSLNVDGEALLSHDWSVELIGEDRGATLVLAEVGFLETGKEKHSLCSADSNVWGQLHVLGIQ
jgi:hypothetical protein